MKEFRQSGFTLVEMMVVVAIIGLLSAIAIPNFKKYQAKAKITEAKLQLSALYTAEATFFSEYNMYAACLTYMGYNPSTETASRYYGMGFGSGVAAINLGAVNSATNAGLGTSCVTSATMTINESFFVAGKGIGGSVVDTQTKMIANAAGAANSTCTNTTTTFGSCVGTQADNTAMAWVASAVGFISGDYADGVGIVASGLQINEKKYIQTVVQGY